MINWIITSFLVDQDHEVSLHDGLPVLNYPRSISKLETYRIIIPEIGFIDIAAFRSSSFYINDIPVPFNNNVAETSFVVQQDGTATATLGGVQILFKVVPLPSDNSESYPVIQTLIDKKILPYPGEQGQTDEELTDKGRNFFAYRKTASRLIAYTVQDWTTANSFRNDVMNDFVYTGVSGFPRDKDTITKMIFTSTWGDYIPSNPTFMSTLLMTPAFSLEEVQLQFNGVEAKLGEYVHAITQVLSEAIQALPRISAFKYPVLYSGQVDVYQYQKERFAPLFREFEGNNGPIDKPLYQKLEDAINHGILQVGKIITTKGFSSFADTYADAQKYSNGIMWILSPPSDSCTWPIGAYVTPLSNGADKIEYLFAPLTKFLITKIEKTDELVTFYTQIVI